MITRLYYGIFISILMIILLSCASTPPKSDLEDAIKTLYQHEELPRCDWDPHADDLRKLGPELSVDRLVEKFGEKAVERLKSELSVVIDKKINKNHWEVARKILNALGSIGETKAERFLITVVNNDSVPEEVRAHAVEAIRYLELPPERLEMIKKIMWDAVSPENHWLNLIILRYLLIKKHHEVQALPLLIEELKYREHLLSLKKTFDRDDINLYFTSECSYLLHIYIYDSHYLELLPSGDDYDSWKKWYEANKDYIYWTEPPWWPHTSQIGFFTIDHEAEKAGIPTEEYRKTHPWSKEEKPDKPDEPEDKPK